MHALLSLLTDPRGRHAALALLHRRALDVTGGTASLLFEPHPATGHLQVTSGDGLDALPLDPWQVDGPSATLLARMFADGASVFVPALADLMPALAERIRTSAGVLLPLQADGRRLGLLAIGVPAAEPAAAEALDLSEVPAGLLLALDLARLRQRDDFERDIRDLLDTFISQLAGRLDPAPPLETLCLAATRLFAADRTTVWMLDRDTRALVPIASSDAGYPARVGSVRADDPMAPAAAALRSPRAGLASSAAEATSRVTVPLRGYRRALGAVVFDGVRVEAGTDIAMLTRADELGRQLSSALDAMQLIRVVTDSRRDLDQLFASMEHPIVVVDREGVITRANRAFADAVGRMEDTLTQTPLAACVGPDLIAWLDALPSPLEGPAMRELNDGGLGSLHVVTVTELRSEAGEPVGRVLVARQHAPPAADDPDPIRERRLQAEKLAALGHFVAGIAHELNNPLQSVLGHLELLRTTGAFPGSIRGEIRVVYREADRAAKIVRNLLVFAGAGRMQKRRASVHGILQKVLSMRKASCRSHGIEVVRHYDQQIPRIHVDPVLLRQVFLNILMNAEQAVAATGRPGRIDVTTQFGREDGWVVVSVRDSGAGISGDTLPRVFEPFYTTRDVGKGAGLGLSLAYGIVQEHAGRISASNHPAGGAVLMVELPIA